jgi:hypothetical protein
MQQRNKQALESPQLKPVVAQRKTAVTSQAVKRPIAPPVYRPQPTPRVLQRKIANDAIVVKPPIAPPVYRPEAKKTIQPKAITPQRKSPVPPPVYRPEQPRIVQPKMASTAPARTQPNAPSIYRAQPMQVSAKQPHQLAQVKSKGTLSPQSQTVMQKKESSFTVSHLAVHLPVQTKLPCRGAIQRSLAPMDNKTIKDFSGFHALGKDKAEEDLTEDDIQRMKDGTYLLTGFHGEVNCNCFGWALGEDRDTGDIGKLYNWKKDYGGAKNFTDPSSESAVIILWGNKEGKGEDTWDVLHASVKLTHAQLLSRSGKFKGLDVSRKALRESGIPDPFWSSAGGMGYGIFVHPRNWFEGGDFGVALKGMKAAK